MAVMGVCPCLHPVSSGVLDAGRAEPYSPGTVTVVGARLVACR